MLNFKHFFIQIIAGTTFLLAALSVSAAEDVWQSSGGSFVVSYSSEIMPVPINQIHQWVLHIENTAGQPVENAELVITGGMPEHDHGMPTSPVVTEYLGDGNFLVEGMRFHMMGYWEIILEITQGSLNESVLIALRI